MNLGGGGSQCLQNLLTRTSESGKDAADSSQEDLLGLVPRVLQVLALSIPQAPLYSTKLPPRVSY